MPSTPAAPEIIALTDPVSWAAAWEVMRELRPHFTQEAFVAQVARQVQGGYRLVGATREGMLLGLAGYRELENLAWGRFFYVDDLVVRADTRSHGVGHALIAWLTRSAREHGCVALHLDSGVQRFGAHRFYLREHFDITCHHFEVKL